MVGEAALRCAAFAAVAVAAFVACGSFPGDAPRAGAAAALTASPAPYCEQTEGPLGFPVYGCEGLTDDPCEAVGCFDHLCRRGKLFTGCCASDGACDDATRFNVCNSHQGRCVPFDGAEVGLCDYGPDADHPRCCFTNTDCVRRMIEGEVFDTSGPACLNDADCGGYGALGSVCREGHCVARCDPDACLADECSAEGLTIVTYPEHRGTCAKEAPICPGGVCGPGTWYACTYSASPDYCAAPSSASTLTIDELMVAPLAVDDEVGEWIEILNTSDHRLNLAGWYLGNGTDAAALDASTRIAAPDGCLRLETGDAAVVCRGSGDPAVNGGVACDVVLPAEAWALDDGGATISLWAPDATGAPGARVDTVTYEADAVVPGVSLALGHPYADNEGPAHWFTLGDRLRTPYNAVDRGSPGRLNLDVLDVAALDPASPGHIDTCDDGKVCTLNLCNVPNQGYCSAHAIDWCGLAPHECETDADCAGFYPPDLDLDVDVVPPPAGPDEVDAAAVRARFDEVMRKLCVQHVCQARKRMEAADGCIDALYPRADLDCNDWNPCTRNRCRCTADDPALCADGDAANGYFACDYTLPTVVGETCCNTADDCPDDGDPSTDADCQAYRCVHQVPPCWCEGPEDCTAATACEIAGCIPCQACTYEPDPAKPGCCASHQDCVQQEVAGAGQDLGYTVNVCCVDAKHAIGDHPELDPLCAGHAAGAGYPTCDVVTGSDFCLTQADCVGGAEGRCLTHYCVAHRCRSGAPELDGDPQVPGYQECCDPALTRAGDANPDCDDADPCTTDACVYVPWTGLGMCTHVPDAAKPGCCHTSDDCPAGEGACDPSICTFDATAGYPRCASLDLAPLGLCCQDGGDCDDGDPCTEQWCLDGLCRAWKPDEACCAKVSDCPPTGDACASKSCPIWGDVGACTVVAVPNCLTNLPYTQDFELEHAFYDAAFDHVGLIGWSVLGPAAAAWQPSSTPIQGNAASPHLRYAPSYDVPLDGGVYVELPRLNTTGQVAATLVFRHALDLVDAPGQGLTVTVQARKSGAMPWQTVWSSGALGTSLAEIFAMAALPAPTLNSLDTRVRFGLMGPGLAAGSAWTLDDVVLARGVPPTLASPLQDYAVAQGADVRLEVLDAFDDDWDEVSFELVGAPGFVALVDPHTATQAGVTHFHADLLVIEAACDGSGAPSSSYPVVVRVSDPWLKVDHRFDLTVTGCGE